MKQELRIEIEVPDGYKAVFDRKTQRVELVDATLPKTWEVFCEENPVKRGEYFIQDGIIMSVIIEGLRDTTTKSVLPNKETAEAFLALMQLVQLRDCYRQGWKPDWTVGHNKYCVLYINNVISIDVRNYSSNILSFQSERICEDFLKNFRELIEIAKELI